MFIDENSKPKEKLKAWYLFTEDFIAGTQHLTNQEIGIYIRLLCWNWNKRCPGLPKDMNTILRIANCITDSEKFSCEKIVNEFFVLINDHYQNERQLQEFLYITKRIEASKENGKLGGRPKKPSTNPPTSTTTPTNKTTSKYNPLFNLFWDKINNKVSKGTAEKNFLRIELEWQDKAEDLAKLYNSYYDSVKDKEYAKQPAFWLSAKKYLDKLPEKNYNFGVVNRDEERLKMFVEAIKNNKVTQFIKDYALRNKDIIDMGIKKGLITKDQAINDLEMRNEYL
tara:strand:- start:1097 stop:1942 length:846 start_codon:yes stop_codon:yes gene_type:complete